MFAHGATTVLRELSEVCVVYGLSNSPKRIRIPPKGPCAPVAYTWVPMYLNRDYIKAKVYTI